MTTAGNGISERPSMGTTLITFGEVASPNPALRGNLAPQDEGFLGNARLPNSTGKFFPLADGLYSISI
jgi:hypothetical protein